MDEPTWTIGIEEEYLLVDQETHQLVREQSGPLLKEARDALEGRARPEFLQAQIEVGTKVCTSIAEAKEDLSHIRRVLIELADQHRIAPVAASTHPFARWRDQLVTEADRYQELADNMGSVMRRLLISGMHVHVGVNNRDLRIDFLNQVCYFLPHLLALSTSSPFWESHDTGLKSYRSSVFRSAPRTGFAEHFVSWSEYERHVNVLVDAGIIEDASKIWWYARPAVRYPTVEMRITDIPSNIDDTICLAALFVTILRMLWRRRTENQRWRSYANFLVEENVWRAQRYGIDEGLLDLGKEKLVPFTDLIEEILELVRPDAEALDCVEEVEHARTILHRGTSADMQLAAYHQSLKQGLTEDQALISVVERVEKETRAGLF